MPLRNRRSFLQIGSLGAFGLGLPDLWTNRLALGAESVGRADPVIGVNGASGGASGFGKARACILMFMWGGPSHIDTWDPKPHAAAEIRGEFQPIETSVAGVQISEHFPQLALNADRYAIVRTLGHDDPAHLSSVHHFMTGRLAPRVKSDADPPSRKDWPCVGSVLSRFRPAAAAVPTSVTMPWTVMHPAAPGGTAPGQHAGWLGAAFDPFLVAGDPNAADFAVSGLKLIEGLSPVRVDARRALLGHLNVRGPSEQSFGATQERAFNLLTSAGVQRAFDIGREATEVRERYGRHIHGQCLLLARRLVEAGVPLVCVNWHQDGKSFWDTHSNNFARLKNELMPPADRGFAALLEDLSSRGMLDDTLLVWVGEFGRRPQISSQNAGREHWPWCGSAVLAGGGIRGGQVYGRSDAQGAYPADNPVTPADLTATIYHALGIQPDLLLRDRENRPQRLTEGEPLATLFA